MTHTEYDFRQALRTFFYFFHKLFNILPTEVITDKAITKNQPHSDFTRDLNRNETATAN